MTEIRTVWALERWKKAPERKKRVLLSAGTAVLNATWLADAKIFRDATDKRKAEISPVPWAWQIPQHVFIWDWSISPNDKTKDRQPNYSRN